ncbi:MAG: diheme cytochrome c [Thiobacillaceae bacterium]|jgi:hypothetical protein
MGITFRSILVLLLALGITAYALNASRADDYNSTFPPVNDKLTRDECSACHMVYPAGLLPARSWSRMMNELQNHFGDDASLPPQEIASIKRYLTENAADSRMANQLMQRIASGIRSTDAPLRFTETPYFGYVHDEVPGSIWKRSKIASKANCIACHTRAETGSFSEREIKIPKE